MKEEKGNKRDIIISEIQSRIQFIIVVATFFSAIMYHFLNLYNNTKSDKIVLSYGSLIAIYVLIYLLFEIFKNKISTNWLKIINVLTLVIVSLFLVQILFFTLAEGLSRSLFNEFLYLFSLYALPVASFFVVIVIILSLLGTKPEDFVP